MDLVEVICLVALLMLVGGAILLGRYCDKKRVDNEKQECIRRAHALESAHSSFSSSAAIRRRPVSRSYRPSRRTYR